jgi:tRNA pseudouridine38-40 synthase
MYDGTKFNGSQIQGEQPTVQLALNNTLSTIFRKPILTFGASRTDEGVHALCNYYHFDTEQEIDFDLAYKCNAILPGVLAVKKIYKATEDFNARFDAIARRYRYRIYDKKDPFKLNRGLFYPFKLDMGVLHETASIIKEYVHFESFSKRNSQSKTFICSIEKSYWETVGDELHYVVEANRFLRGMVRGLVGTQLHIARGRASVADFREIIDGKDCTKAFFDVAGFGLYLEQIRYKDGALVEI